MSNLFDSDNYPTVEPEVLTIGDRWLWKRTDLGTTHHPVMHFPTMPDYKVLGQLRLASQLQNLVTITWWKSRLQQRQVT